MTFALLSSPRDIAAAAAFIAAITLATAALASPGAHGPNGEHLDSNQPGAAAVSTLPRLEAKSELFELVGHLSSGELSMLIDRFDTNQPVLKAEVEIESGNRKAKATFHADLGDYAVDDAEMLKLLASPGEHPIVVTILAGKDTDLLDGVLRVGSQAGAKTAGQVDGHGHAHDGEGAHDEAAGHRSGGRWFAGAVVLAAVGLGWHWRRRAAGDRVARQFEGSRA